MAAQPTVVIVVDDNAGLLKGVARLLALNGIESRTFASAEALLESGSAPTATCLLLDIHLGGISGIELQRRLATSGSKCPVIFMTANDDEATHNEAVEAGASPICASRLRIMSCWTPLEKLWPNRRGVTKPSGVVTSELGQSRKSGRATWRSALPLRTDLVSRTC
jgi:DNA-binding NtrC family response regulator